MNNENYNVSSAGSHLSSSYTGGKRNNLATSRGHFMYYQGANVVPSRNMTEAKIASLRLYRRVCRLLPFILRVWSGFNYSSTSVHTAKQNLAEHFREKTHLRDPVAVDNLIRFGYIVMHNAEHKHSDWYHFQKYLMPAKTPDSAHGISYLDKVKFGNKSKFLTGFYKGDRPNY